ncbi:phosphoglycerate mutase [Planotetraspora thailandica]|uniref:Phosphoglycerate mutase n=1 Tax=Planotetraspora thailandica TaxID=487172 RepID=A0A8J3XT32_9ACTN|nr:histidine phosphatase family protein [Planotetraspora thailandica]GII51799.1 phosphoglycerate mutase [Planotetraspora thailandica]
MTTRLTLVSHALTAAMVAAAFPADEPVDGRRLTGRSGPWEGPTAALRGPELRCAQTARWLGLEAESVQGLRDCDFGSWRGRTLADVQADDPEGVGRWLADPGAAPHGGESVHDLIGRVRAWLAEQAPGRAVGVTHPAVIRAAVVHALGAPPGAFWRVDVGPLGRVELTGRDGRWNLRLGAGA